MLGPNKIGGLQYKTIKRVVLTDGHIEVNPCLNLLGLYSDQVPVRKRCLFLLRIGWLVTLNFVSQNTSAFFVNKCVKWKVWKVWVGHIWPAESFLPHKAAVRRTHLFILVHTQSSKQFQVPLTVLCLCLHSRASVTQQCVTGICMKVLKLGERVRLGKYHSGTNEKANCRTSTINISSPV